MPKSNAPARKAPKKRAVAQPRAPRQAPLIRQPAMRKSSGIRPSKMGSALGSAIGMALGGPAGGMVGNALGGIGGSVLSKILGHGDYTVSNVQGIKENSLVVANAANIPEFGTGRVAVKFRHREFLGDVISSSTAGAFKIDSYAINPGLPASFPWLAQVCGSTFQQHRINGLTYEFRSMSSDALNSTNTALGSVIMATDYDSPDNVFTTKQQMENTEFGVSCKPSVNMMHAIECARAQTPVSELYIRAYANPPNTDLRLYDLGRFSIASVGCQGTSVNLGELWATYDIDCFKAIEQPPGYTIQMAHYNLVVASGTPTAPLALDLSVNAVQPQFDTIGIASITNTVLTLPLSIPNGSTWMLCYLIRGASTASLVPPTVVAAGGLVANNWFQDQGSNSYIAPQTVNTSTTIMIVNIYKYNGTGTLAVPPTLTFGTSGVFPTGNSGGDLVLLQTNGRLGVY